MSTVKATPGVRAVVLELRAAGKSYRAIETALEELGTPLSRQGIGRVLKEAAEGVPDEPPEPASTYQVPPRGELLDLPELPPNASVAARMLYQDIRMFHDQIAEIYGEVVAGDTDRAVEMNDLAMKKRLLVRDLDAILPPPSEDPATDPSNEKARAALLRRVLESVEDVELRVGRICPRCLGALGST